MHHHFFLFLIHSLLHHEFLLWPFLIT
jgi:hypothetical protein